MTNPYSVPEANIENTGEMIPCIGCGKELHFTASSCPHCGASQRSSRYKSKTTAALFAFFLGGFGAHRFYLGQWWGIFYLLFFWAWIPGLIAFVEFIVFLCSNQRKWDDKYNEGKPAGPNDKTGGVAIAILVIFGGFMILAIVGILAAVSIPAYQDYTVRAKVSEAIVQVHGVKGDVQEFYANHSVLPSANVMVGLSEPLLLEAGHEVVVSEKGIELILSGDGLIDQKTVFFTPVFEGEQIVWLCRDGTLELKYRPASCR